MNAKKTNWLFTTIIALNVLAVVAVTFFSQSSDVEMAAIPALLLSQAIIFIPAVLFLAGTRTKAGDLIAWAKPKWSVSLLVILLTFLCMPLIVTVNAFSMLFVENEVTNLQVLLQGVPAWQIVLMIGILGPASEEFVFRGVIYHGYRRSGRIVAAMLMSAVLFGLIHLNFNQMSYAILVGVLGVLLIEGTGSIFYSFLFHACVNLTNVIQLLLQDPETAAMDARQTRQMIETMMQMPYEQAMCIVIAVYAVISCFTTALAGCLYYLILKKEGRTQHIRLMFTKEEKGGVKDANRRIISWPLAFSMALCLMYMIAELAWMK
ncbi:MAG: CPBP family intramembrane metalloprotease [Lachnospiraceae bacterium]|nr:CPBP family intramembrane metalloprotease [Lachnospiraceae bacterium]